MLQKKMHILLLGIIIEITMSHALFEIPADYTSHAEYLQTILHLFFINM